MTPPDDQSPGLLAHVLGALRFDARAYAALAVQRTGLAQGTAVVLLGGLSRGIGSFPDEGWRGVLLGIGVGLGVWLAAALAIWCAGFALERRAPAFRSLLAALGLAASPLLLLALSAWPPAASSVRLIAHAWATLSAVLAVREAERVSTARAALICVIALAVGMLLLVSTGADDALRFEPPWNRPCALPGLGR
jgi:hypothetical protein